MGGRGLPRGAERRRGGQLTSVSTVAMLGGADAGFSVAAERLGRRITRIESLGSLQPKRPRGRIGLPDLLVSALLVSLLKILVGPTGSGGRGPLAAPFAPDAFRPLASCLDRFRSRRDGRCSRLRLILSRKRWNLISRSHSTLLVRRTPLAHNNERCPVGRVPCTFP